MQNYTVRPVLWKQRKDAQGYCRLKICITTGGKQIYVMTSQKLKEDQWDAKMQRVTGLKNDKAINSYIGQQLAEIEKKVIQQLAGGGVVSSRFFKGETAKAFEDFAKEVRNDAKEINRIRQFANRGLQITDIDVAFLRKYETNERARGMSQNTINTTFKFLRRILRQAYAEKLIRENPFDHFKVPKYVQSERVYLLEPEKARLLKLLDKKEIDPGHYKTLCYFLLGCYSGLRHSDWVTFDPEKMVQDGFLRLRAKKNKQWVSLPVGPTLADIVARIKAIGEPPVSKEKCNGHLKVLAVMGRIDKHLTCHVSRHTFATACASLKIPHGVTAELMGINYRTVSVYYHITGASIIEQAAVLKSI
jgi:site-specific recombinase XerD